MRKIDSIGCIGGGQMGEALVRGMIVSKVLAPDMIMVAEPDAGRRDYLKTTYGIKVTDDASLLCAQCSVLILAVKPQIMGAVLSLYTATIDSHHLVISIAAGVTIATIENGLPDAVPIIRVMPNTPALVLAGASVLSPNAHAGKDEMEVGQRIFSAVGTCVELPESLLDAVTGLSGSGPGYVFTFIEAMVDGGVLAGIPRPVAQQLVMQTFYGSALLGLETGEAPAVLKGKVTSPGGTTIAGLQVLEEKGIRGAIMSAVQAATERSKKLGS